MVCVLVSFSLLQANAKYRSGSSCSKNADGVMQANRLFIFNYQIITFLMFFTEKPNYKPLKHNVVYIPITTSSHVMLMMSK